MSAGETVIRLNGVAKSFTMHLRGGAVLPVVQGVGFEAARGECVVLGGPSGIGKSSILKMIYGNYRVDRGEVWLKHRGSWVDIVSASPRLMLTLRHDAIGYVSQFLRAIPRISALDLVVATAREAGLEDAAAKVRASELLERLALPRRLWGLPPATFSGGEQQRVNIARSFAGRHPVLLLDEPTASLDAASRARVVELIAERRDAGGTLIGVFHDEGVRNQLADRIVDVAAFAAAAACEANSPQL